jgi:hypothetical protein
MPGDKRKDLLVGNHDSSDAKILQIMRDQFSTSHSPLPALASVTLPRL